MTAPLPKFSIHVQLLFANSFCCVFILKASQVCYGKYGCFNDNKPFLNKFFVKLPQHPLFIGTRFHLFTREQQQASIIYDYNKAKLSASNFKISRRTIFLVHGYKGKYQSIRQSINQSINQSIKVTETPSLERVILNLRTICCF